MASDDLGELSKDPPIPLRDWTPWRSSAVLPASYRCRTYSNAVPEFLLRDPSTLSNGTPTTTTSQIPCSGNLYGISFHTPKVAPT